MFPGRSEETKRNLYQMPVRHLEARGIPPADVLIVLQESERVDWSIRGSMRGGIPAGEVDLGFEINV